MKRCHLHVRPRITRNLAFTTMRNSSTEKPATGATTERPADIESLSGRLQLLLLEDSGSDACLIRQLLRRELSEKFTLTVKRTVNEAVSQLESGGWDLVVADLMVPDSSGINTFRTIQSHAGSVPIVVVSGTDDEELAIEAVRLGAQDYLVKGQINRQLLLRTLRFAVERARHIKVEKRLASANKKIEAANTVQQCLYPKVAPTLTGFDVQGAAFPAGAGCGDYFDFMSFENGEQVFVIADVAGHGLDAALLMVETRAILKTLIREQRSITTTLNTLNAILSSDVPVGRFVTLFLAKLNLHDRVFTWSAAGHQARLLNANGQSTRLPASGPPLGLMSAEYSESSISLNPGDTVLMLTDGFEESISPTGDLLGARRLETIARKYASQSAKSAVEQCFKAARQHAEGEPQKDDMAAIVIRAL